MALLAPASRCRNYMTGQANGSDTASMAMTGQAECSETASLAVTAGKGFKDGLLGRNRTSRGTNGTSSEGAVAFAAASGRAVAVTATFEGAGELCAAQTHKMVVAIKGSTVNGGRTFETTGLGTTSLEPPHLGGLRPPNLGPLAMFS
ncbi:hypothetical protein DPX16_22443 [Anabarilius grahami]|uniref:Uncharacterized protein n=1 Tax=Anabarilius grahami TaxID=495550 RepID=A0A3N0YYH5_ANAGA|nr:hypothetical protein DPX16_22443 [Anabarilius grahami]